MAYVPRVHEVVTVVRLDRRLPLHDSGWPDGHLAVEGVTRQGAIRPFTAGAPCYVQVANAPAGRRPGIGGALRVSTESYAGARRGPAATASVVVRRGASRLGAARDGLLRLGCAVRGLDRLRTPRLTARPLLFFLPQRGPRSAFDAEYQVLLRLDRGPGLADTGFLDGRVLVDGIGSDSSAVTISREPTCTSTDMVAEGPPAGAETHPREGQLLPVTIIFNGPPRTRLVARAPVRIASVPDIAKVAFMAGRRLGCRVDRHLDALP